MLNRRKYTANEIKRMRQAIQSTEKHGGWNSTEIEEQVKTYMAANIAPEELEVIAEKEITAKLKEADAWYKWLNEHPADRKNLRDAQIKAWGISFL